MIIKTKEQRKAEALKVALSAMELAPIGTKEAVLIRNKYEVTLKAIDSENDKEI